MKAIALIGFMGAGKTSVGRLLAEKLEMKFVDLDELIEEKAKMTVLEIFRLRGENYFRKVEAETLKGALQVEDTVISTGGGSVIRSENREILRSKSIVIYLTAGAGDILKRVGNTGDSRPLLNVDSPLHEIERLLEKRQPLYENVADITVDTTGMEINLIVDKVINEVNNLNSKNRKNDNRR